ncbi:MAG: helix-turn-helix transcriptional regulator [Clostridia bacterium]|nr:helix-turn-helix transcriptional regulator [Clostridia bacterium]
MIKISEYRKLKGMTQKELANRLGVSAGNLCEWEKGRIEPSISALIKISNILDITIDELIGTETTNYSPVSADESSELLYYFKQLDYDSRKLIVQITKQLSSK